MKKELSPSTEMVACDVCGRTILKGERTEPFRIPDGSRRQVCELCIRRAESAGWLRESVHGDLPATAPRTEPRRSLLGRLRRRLEVELGRGERASPQAADPAEHWSGSPRFGAGGRPAAAEDAMTGQPELDQYEPDPAEEAAYPDGTASTDPVPSEPAPSPEQVDPVEGPRSMPESGVEQEPFAREPPPESPQGQPVEGFAPSEPALPEVEPVDARAERRERRSRRRLRDPRHVRAVPTNAEAKVERALEIFNLSDFRRTVGGLVRTLGTPWVTARPHEDSTAEVTVVVAWELSWYQFRVDLGDAAEPVAVADKGHEVDEIDAELRRWNATATDDGALVPGVPTA